MLMLEDVKRAEKDYNSAAAELRQYQRDTRGWAGHESVDRDGHKSLELAALHFDRLEQLQQKLERAHQNMLAIRRDWVEGK